MVRSKIKVYESLDNYIGDYTIISDIELANFGKIFKYLFYLYVLLILTFVFNLINRKVIKTNIKELVRKLQRYFYIYSIIILSKIIKYLNEFRLKANTS